MILFDIHTKLDLLEAAKAVWLVSKTSIDLWVRFLPILSHLFLLLLFPHPPTLWYIQGQLHNENQFERRVGQEIRQP